MAFNQHVQDIMNEQERAIEKSETDCMLKFGPNTRSNDPYLDHVTKKMMCPPFFDLIYCWPPQLPNTTASVSCPRYVIGFIQFQANFATRKCNENAKWFTKNDVPYTNYSDCVNDKVTTVYTNISQDSAIIDHSAESLNIIKVVIQTGYAISLISLIIAFTIMFKIKKLHCARNILHMNLFASFILRSFMHILKDALFVNGIGLSKDMMLDSDGREFFHVNVMSNNFECKLIVSMLQYFTAANYSWILMEGLYLNNLILRALFTDSNKNLAYYITLGWGLPVLVVSAWVVARILLEDNLCWTTNDDFRVFSIIIIPTLASVLINLILFVIISIVLYNKLKSPINEDSRRYLKWAKSTLVLVPLFGVNYAFFLVLYFLNEKFIWMLCDGLFGSFQGFFVAILYCFLNGEVKSEVKPYITSVLLFLATNNFTKCCFPRRQKYLSSAAGRQSVSTTMSCSSLYNNGVNHHRNSKTKLDQLTKIKLNNLHSDSSKDLFISNGTRHSVPKSGNNGHYAPNLTFVHGRYPMNTTTNNLDLSLAHARPHNYSQNLPTCEEEVSMLEDLNVKDKLDNKFSRI
ncbi:unnamed protein product [Ceutorhynchus assimilis]|uniref:Uncharacterized protein n=1 Tax=Ceutorhynchus assimilis TaxID=467358 RepID=A0A9N9MQM0_9CUCU|nr:unnamed protein product [Ceutorhynchus assimilis]